MLVCEVDPVKALEAAMDGYEPVPLLEACERAETILTVTGKRNTLLPDHFLRMKDGAVVANAGHFQSDIDMEGLAAITVERSTPRDTISSYRVAADENEQPRLIHLLGDGHIVNIACGDGHAADIIELSFALQLLGARHLVEQRGALGNEALLLPDHLDREVASLKLRSMGIEIDDGETPERRE